MKIVSFLTALAVLVGVSGQGVRADVIPLYNGAANTTPSSQGWLYLTDPLIGAMATQSAASGVTTLDSTAEISEKAGYFGSFHPSIPALDRAAGFTVSFDLRIVSETHNNANRAGFSVIALSQDLKGIELGFWTDEIWAQSAPAFTHAEGQTTVSPSLMRAYDLTILGDKYFLFADGVGILSGDLRDYSSFGAPYNVPDFLFFGDDTSSASALAELESIGLKNGADTVLPAAIPLPGALPLFVAALIGLGFVGRRETT